MPLLDHFHPPVNQRLGWSSLHSGWATYLASNLSERWLPSPYLAAENTRRSLAVEVDVGTFDASPQAAPGVAVVTEPRVWTVPPPLVTVEVELGDAYEVLVYADDSGWRLVGAIELVSEKNKDCPSERAAFVGKCLGLLAQGVAVVVVDVVTNRHSNLHNELLRLIEVETGLLPDDSAVYTSAYHPVARRGKTGLDVWAEPLVLGAPLPTMPLRVSADLVVPVELEETYSQICRLRLVI
jgi:hypothetical protein